MKSDLWGLDLLTPVFLRGNQSSNCFGGVPDPFALHTAFQSRKHDLYLTHVLFSSSFMSEQSLWWCLFWGRRCLWVWALRENRGGEVMIYKTALFFFSYLAFTLYLYTLTNTFLILLPHIIAKIHERKIMAIEQLVFLKHFYLRKIIKNILWHPCSVHKPFVIIPNTESHRTRHYKHLNCNPISALFSSTLDLEYGGVHSNYPSLKHECQRVKTIS